MSQTKTQLVDGFNINTSVPADSFVIDSSGNVGLGTSSPGSYYSGADNLVVANTSGNAGITVATATTGTGRLYFADGTSGADEYRGWIEYGHTADALTLGSNGATAVTIDSSQRVGIGTTTVSYPLSVKRTTDGGIAILDLDNQDAGNYGGLRVHLGKTDRECRLEATYDSSFFTFYTAAPSSSATERARIDSSGRLLVGTPSPYADSGELFEVHKANGPNNGWVSTPNLANDDSVSWRTIGGVSGASLRQSGIGVYKHSGIATPCGFLYMQAQNADTLYYWTDNSSNLRISTLASNIGTTGGTVVGTQTSDERIKNIIGPVEYGLETVKQINSVRYSLKADPETEKLGFIAQQVAPLVPQAIYDTNEPIEGEPEGVPTKLGMEYVSLIPVLVNAIKELSAEVDALKAQLQTQ